MIYRIDVQTKTPGRGEVSDSAGESLQHQIREFGIEIGAIRTSRIFLIEADATIEQMRRVAEELLADPIVETAQLINQKIDDGAASRIEVHLKPGVMDPVASSTEAAIASMGIAVKQVRTGRAVVIQGSVPKSQLERIAARVLANGVIESVHFDVFLPAKFEAGRQIPFQLEHVSMRQLSDEQLTKLSREGHLFLSLAEMKAIQNYFRQQEREPSDIELETLAQTWSEHCVHKTLKSAVDVEVRDEKGKMVGSRRYGNLIKETIFRATSEAKRDDFCLSVFADNAGVVAFDETDAVCFKVETHNHPSAIEPYGGSATGVGGVIRDILGTGLGAKPIANTDVFCVADPFLLSPSPGTPGEGRGEGPHPNPLPEYQERGQMQARALPRGVIHPRRVLQQVVAGVRDYGNRMGIPTVNGAVYFDNRYLGNPLVFCGCVGLIPRDKIAKQSKAGDAIVVLGGRTGRDGIHGATFSSAELTDTHADEFSHAVQIGNAITEKKTADVLLQARDRGLFNAITDCGAGGLSSAVGEMGEKLGAVVDLDKVPLKYAGLRYDEIWISEAQERMVIAVPPAHVEEILKLAAGEDVDATVIGKFGTENRELILRYQGNQVGNLSMHFLHDGIPMPSRRAVVVQDAPKEIRVAPDAKPFKERLLEKLAHPNIASKHWIIRQYDHEVQGGSVIKPLTGPRQVGPSDAAVIRPKLNSYRGVAIGCGLCPEVADPYWMAIAAIDEAIRNIICVGADYGRIAILDNFCWPSVDDELSMGTLVRACEACYDAAKAYGIPFISGKDSLNNQFTNQETKEVIRIPNTLLISAMGIVEDVHKCVTMDFKRAGAPVYLVRAKDVNDLSSLSQTHRAMAKLIADGDVAACHDVSDGGIAVAAAEMCIASGLGLNLESGFLPGRDLFAEEPGGYLIELRGDKPAGLLGDKAEIVQLGRVESSPWLANGPEKLSVDQMTAAWRGILDW